MDHDAEEARPRWERLRLPDREAMTADQRRIYDGSVERFGGPYGPRIPFVLTPELNAPWDELGVQLHHGSLPPDVREFAILATAKFWRAGFIWWAHHRIAAETGLPRVVVECLRVGAHATALPERFELVARFCADLLERRDIGDDLYDELRTALGQRGVVELTVVVGHYTGVALNLIAHDAPPPPEGAAP